MRTAVFHGVEIPETLLAQEAQHHPGLSAAEARTAAGHALATKALLLRRAEELGLEPEPEFDEDGREETAEAALVRAVLDAEVDVMSPTETECRRVYEARRSQFPSQAPYEAVAERIRLHLESRAWGRAASAYVIRLAAAAREQGVALTLSESGRVSNGSACLGDFLGDGETVGRVEAWLGAVDPGLCERLRHAAQAEGLSSADFVRSSAATFIAEADDERWTQLISAAQAGADPALAAFAAILRARLEPPRRSFTVISRRNVAAAPVSDHP